MVLSGAEVKSLSRGAEEIMKRVSEAVDLLFSPFCQGIKRRASEGGRGCQKKQQNSRRLKGGLTEAGRGKLKCEVKTRQVAAEGRGGFGPHRAQH